MSPCNAAIYLEIDGYSTSTRTLMGRQAAGEGFLRAYVRDSGVRPFYCYSGKREAVEWFRQFCDAHGVGGAEVRHIGLHQFSELERAGTLYLPGPTLHEAAWRRRGVSSRAYSLCGVTHTISSQLAMDCIAACHTAPVEPWDALVCTSRAVQDSIRRLLDAHATYLRDRFGATAVPEPQLPLIPLGADCEALTPDGDARATWRGGLGISHDEVAFLFLGRLSFHGKANPFPMFVALERASTQTGRRLHFILAGWFHNERIERAFRDAARELCPSVNCHFLDGREPEVRRAIWHAADVFISLPDNIQETFGLTPVEAMSAGLPCVVSDWDGYRDTVRAAVDGYHVPTFMPHPPAGENLAQWYDIDSITYDRYIGYASQFISVDVAAAAEACVALAQDASLRRSMGEAARQRACAEFDWRVIVRRYQDLWSELGKLRRAAGTREEPPFPGNPARADPYWLFAGYATHRLCPETRLETAAKADPAQMRRLRSSPIVEYAQPVLPPESLCGEMIEFIAVNQGCRMAALMERFSAIKPAALERAVLWLHKLDLVRVAHPDRATQR